MNGIAFTRALMTLCAVLGMSVPAFAQIDISGSYSNLMHEDYIERGPGSFLGDYTGVPLTDDGRAKALSYTSNQPSTVERQCLAQSPWIMLHRPLGLKIWSETDYDGTVIAWVMGGNYLRADIRIWMDGRPHPSPNAQHLSGGFNTGTWEGDTLTVRTTHAKTQWIRRGVGIPGSDKSTFTTHITRHDDLLTLMVIQEDPVYLTEPYIVSRVWRKNPRAGQGGGRVICNTANEIPRLEDSGIVPHYLQDQNPEEDYMARTFNLPQEAAMGHAETLYPEYRKTIRNSYTPPADCWTRAPGYCCAWIERQGLPGGAPNLTCNDGGFGVLGPRGRRSAVENSSQ